MKIFMLKCQNFGNTTVLRSVSNHIVSGGHKSKGYAKKIPPHFKVDKRTLSLSGQANRTGTFRYPFRQLYLQNKYLHHNKRYLSKAPTTEHNDNVEKSDRVRLGKLCVKHSAWKYTLSSIGGQESNSGKALVDKNITKLFGNHGDEESFYDSIGKECLKDINKCQKQLRNQLHDQEATHDTKRGVPYLLKNIEKAEGASLDRYSDRNANVTNSVRKLPRLEQAGELFHPTILIESKENAPGTGVSSLLGYLRDFGMLTFELYIYHSLLKQFKNSENIPTSLIVKVQKYVKNIMNGSDLMRTLLEESSHSQSNPDKTNVFFRYIGLLELVNRQHENLVERWTRRLMKTFLISEQKNIARPHSEELLSSSLNYSITPRKTTITLDQNLLHKVFSNLSTGNSVLYEIDLLGKQFIKLAFRHIATAVNLRRHEVSKEERRFVERAHDNLGALFKDFTQINNSPHLSNLSIDHFVGLWAISDYENCFQYLLSMANHNDYSFSKTFEYINKFIHERKVPLSEFKLLEEPKNGLIYSLPTLKNLSNASKFLFINPAVVVARKRSNSYITNEEVKHCLYAFKDFGELCYTVPIKIMLFQSLSDSSLPYYNKILKILTSNGYFCKLLDNSDIFTAFNDPLYQSVLIEKRYTNNLINSQFCQYISAVYMTDRRALSKWYEYLLEKFVKKIDGLSHSAVTEVLEKLENDLYSYKSKLRVTQIEESLKRMKPDEIFKVDYTDPYTPLGKTRLEEIGRHYFEYVQSLYFISYGLDSFISAKDDIALLIEKAYARSTMSRNKRSSPFQYIGLMTIDTNSRDVKEEVNQLIRLSGTVPAFLNEKRIPHLDIRLNEFKSSGNIFIWDNPKLPLDTAGREDMKKLLLINFHISRTYLKHVGCQRNNIHELPDICTKFNSVGGLFYNYCIKKHMYSLGELHKAEIDPQIVSEIVALMLDRIFMTMISDFSLILYSPFQDATYSELIRGQMKNSYFFLRLGSQSFRQYMGFLGFHDPAIGEAWVKNIVDLVFQHLLSISPGDRKTFVSTFRSYLNDYYIRKTLQE